MPRYYLTGGRQRPSHLLSRDEWHAYDKAVLIELDTDTGATRTVLSYGSPSDRTPPKANHVFKAASWDGDRLLLCTQTEVLVFDPEAEQITRTLSHPWMNDVHHVARIGGQLQVVSTGLDALLTLTDDGELVEIRSATGASPWDRFDQGTDYRRVPTTKPHACHPNYVLETAAGRWLSRFEQRDVLPLDAPGRAPIKLAEDPVHDGVPDGDEAWFTVVSGEVVRADLAEGRVVQRFRLKDMQGEEDRPLGWCRGIHREPDRTLLAFSRLRPTKLKQNLRWLRKPLGKAPEPAPTRVCAYDLEGGRKLQTWTLEDAGISSVFSILPARS